MDTGTRRVDVRRWGWHRGGIWLLVALLALVSACASINAPISGPKLTAKEVPAEIERARKDREAGRYEKALDRLAKALKARAIPSSVRVDLDRELELVAKERIEQLSGATEGNPKELVRMLDLGLPAPVAATAGVRAAEIYLKRDKNYKAWTTIKKTETKYPLHHESRAAGAALVQAGLNMASDTWSFLGLFRTRDDGMAALEYLVVTYPTEPRCDEAFAKLAQIYEDQGEWDLAIQRWSELIKWQRGSSLKAQAEARIPRVRLQKIESPEFDRAEILQAQTELKFWLERHPGHEWENAVRADLADAKLRLLLSDEMAARYYRRIRKPVGARLHAERALAQAKELDDRKAVLRCEKLLAGLAPDAAPVLAGAAP